MDYNFGNFFCQIITILQTPTNKRVYNTKKGQPSALELLHTQGLRRGPSIFGVLYAALPCFLHKRLFS